jgi:hypothetical protein
MSTGDWPYGNVWPYGTSYGTYTTTTTGGPWITYQPSYPQTIYPPTPQPKPQEESPKIKLPEGVVMKKLYEVYLVYGEDRKKPIVEKAQVIADSDEDAKVKSGLMAKVNPEWDADYLTIAAVEIIEVKVKERPKEVKQV